MKYIQTFVLAAICVSTFAFQASAQNIKNGVATIVRVQGEARYKKSDSEQWHPLVAGQILHAGAVIQTAKNAYVDVVLGKQIQMPQARPIPDRVDLAPDSLERGMVSYKPSAEQNVIRLWESTTIAIDKLTVSDTGVDTVSDTELDLKQGRIFGNVKKMSAASQYLIKIPNGIAGIRGTFFMLDASGNCAVSKQSGHSLLLSIIGADGQPKTILVGPGFMYDPATGQSGPIPPGLISLLSEMFSAVNTVYLELTSFSYDLTQKPISPGSGHKPPHPVHPPHPPHPNN